MADMGRELPKLATYLGHVDVAHTYWYLEAVLFVCCPGPSAREFS
jgi:hypothetical protein